MAMEMLSRARPPLAEGPFSQNESLPRDKTPFNLPSPKPPPAGERGEDGGAGRGGAGLGTLHLPVIGCERRALQRWERRAASAATDREADACARAQRAPGRDALGEDDPALLGLLQCALHGPERAAGP